MPGGGIGGGGSNDYPHLADRPPLVQQCKREIPGLLSPADAPNSLSFRDPPNPLEFYIKCMPKPVMTKCIQICLSLESNYFTK